MYKIACIVLSIVVLILIALLYQQSKGISVEPINSRTPGKIDEARHVIKTGVEPISSRTQVKTEEVPHIMKTGEPIHVDMLNQHDVIGKLGLPLGHTADIEAEIVSGESMKMKEYWGRYLLKVSSVNGVPLRTQPILTFQLPFGNGKLANDHFKLYEMKKGKRASSLSNLEIKEIEKGYVGSVVKLIVYEAGEFYGLPKVLPPEVDVWADRGFHFSTYLEVLFQR
ncbi:MAG TPA: hypothetical protein VEK08_24295 [Planctomycetota bacterium]|nr:hypothetical protein [Planctomycetota bacterium]